MINKYICIYNYLVKLSRNKDLYYDLRSNDVFEDRLLLFLLHFSFFLNTFKNPNEKKTIQDIYDSIFRYLELTIREIGYGDQSINRKMKDYINVHYSIITEIYSWSSLDVLMKKKKLLIFLKNYKDINHIVDYFDEFSKNLSKFNLKSFLKHVNTLDYGSSKT